METFVIEYTLGDGYTWSSQEVAVVLAESKEELYCFIVDSRAEYLDRRQKIEKVRKTLWEKLAVGQKDHRAFVKAFSDAVESHGGLAEGMKFMLHGYNLTGICRHGAVESEDMIEENDILFLQEWVDRKLAERFGRTQIF